jgi:cytochrome oxidase Cu insertion factor (SCO1/SenC/PrrC family)
VTTRQRGLWGLGLALVASAGGVVAWALVSGQPVLRVWGARDVGSSEGVLETLGVYGEVPAFRLTERSGRPVSRADLLGKVWIANFIYTQCRETCPIQTALLARLQPEFAGEADLRVVSITVDPEHDTAAALRSYAEQYGADAERWLFLTGDKRAIYRLAKEGFHLGVVDPNDPGQAAGLLRWLEPARAFATHGSQGLIMHSSRLVLVDRQARVRAYHLPDDESLPRLRRNVTVLLRERAKGA